MDEIRWMTDESWEGIKACGNSFDLKTMDEITGEIGTTTFLNVQGTWYAQRNHGGCMRILPLAQNPEFSQAAAYLAVRLLEIEDENKFEEALRRIQEVSDEWLKPEAEILSEP